MCSSSTPTASPRFGAAGRRASATRSSWPCWRPARDCRRTRSSRASKRRSWPPRKAGCATTWRSWPSAPHPNPGRAMADTTDATASNGHQDARDDLLRELVAHLRNNRTDLRQEWARRIGEAKLLTALTEEEIFSEATSVYDNYVEVLETGSVEALQDYARNLSERI